VTVKKTSLWTSALMAVIAITLVAQTASAQATQPAASGSKPHQVGLIDLAHIFKNYKKFEDQTSSLEALAKNAEMKGQQKIEQMKAVQAKLQTLTAGSPDYNAQEGELIRLQTELQTFRQVEQREIVRKQAELYKAIYVEVQGAVKLYAEHYNYTLIMRFNRAEVAEAANPNGIIQSMNRQVVFYNESDDLTDPILNHLNSQYSQTAGR